MNSVTYQSINSVALRPRFLNDGGKEKMWESVGVWLYFKVDHWHLLAVLNYGDFLTKSQVLSQLELELSKLRHPKGIFCLLYYDIPSTFVNQTQGAYVIMIFGRPTLLRYPQYTFLSAYIILIPRLPILLWYQVCLLHYDICERIS